jgi:hypothetical protein
MTRGAKAAAVIEVAAIVGLVGVFMYGITTFLFHFSGGQARMGPLVDYGALAIIAGTLLLAVIVWNIRSPTAAVKSAAIATPVAWVVAVFVDWGFSQFVFVTGAP